MGESQRGQFVDGFDLNEPVQTACIRVSSPATRNAHSPLKADDDPTGPLQATN